MTLQERISKLNNLLERVRRNASAPRPAPTLFAPHPGSEPARREEAAPAPAATAAPAQPAPAAPAPIAAAPAAAPGFARPAEAPQPEREAAAPELDIVEVEFLDEEIVDITDLPADEIALLEADAGGRLGADREESIEEPPASSRRPIAASMDEALASAADQVEPEREVPLKTPPPESGRQVAMPPSSQLQQPPPPPDLAEEALDRGPSMEQLGGLVELEERSPVDLELGAIPPVAGARVSDVFEAELEPSEPAGVASSGLELERPSEPISEPAVSQVVSVSSVLPVAKVPGPAAKPAELGATPAAEASPAVAAVPEAAAAPQLFRREAGAEIAPVFVASPPRRPETFLQLLESSLSL